VSLSRLFLAIWLILVGLAWLLILSISNELLGFLAVITGLLVLLEGVAPSIAIGRRSDA
jgi:hypothetical protein